MNVSSVKNLNGEVLSAVQDASLTNVIQTNSGNWQDITAYQNASAKYLTGVSHDNTLSGNGTVESPLGVVPGYNETVLFEDTNGHGMDNSIELSENVDNFDSIKLYYNCWGGASPRVLEFFYDKGNINYVTNISNLEQFSTGGLKVINWQFNSLDSTNKRTLTLNYFAYFDGSFNGTDLTKSNFLVYKVIGCNRISGSNA